MRKITPFLWFDNNAEEVVNFCTTIFNNLSAGNASLYDEVEAEVSGIPKGFVK
ncbi:MAG: VOC family protein [Ignavibacteriaceae bacterium]|jgi:predicted 3-demethylubiquinone-9 3-methyltransferase (glyoxalase superfamily)